MPITATSIDPLAHFIEAITRRGNRQPIPLVATRIDVTIGGGLATVTTERSFRNTEKKSIEATMTFPVPVDATLCALSAKIDGRVLTAVAQARRKARETYEEALDQGKSAVLHEELLKGIHMLSVGHVGPGTEIIVSDTWTAPLSFVDATPRLRVPTTVGEIYGRSPLPASDDLVTADVTREASVGLACEDGVASLLRAGPMQDGRYAMTLDQPIDVAVTGWRHRILSGVAADGRSVTLDIAPAPKAEAPLDVAVLFDHSGSMGEHAVGDPEVSASKFEVAKTGLLRATQSGFKTKDCLRIWQFDDGVEFLGEAAGSAAPALVKKIQGPAGGTEIGRAFDAAIASEKAKNIVVITDGKTWAFDPQRLARTGIRVTAVLIGEDAIEAGIAHLAGMTGGQTFVAAGSEAGAAIAAALHAAREPHTPSAAIDAMPAQVEALRRGARIKANWGAKVAEAASPQARQVGATAAMLAVPLMDQEAATKLAEAEGVVCHLTSLVLVDEAGARHEGIPATRKVALSTPVTAMRAMRRGGMILRDMGDSRALMCAAPFDDSDDRHLSDLLGSSRSAGRKFECDEAPLAPSAPTPVGAAAVSQPHLPDINLGRLVGRIDWETDPDGLRNGDLSGLAPDVLAAILAAAQLPQIVAFAHATGIDRIIAVVALLAKAASSKSRAAQRIARAILSRAPAKDLKAAMDEVGL